MEEARSLSFGITISTIITQAEEDIQHLMGMLGTLRAEAAGDVDIIADTEEASGSVRDLADEIGRLQSDAGSTDIIVDADTESAGENVRDLTGQIGNLGERSADIDIDVDTEQAQTDLHDLEDRVTNLGQDPPDIDIDVDTERAQSDLQDLTDDIGDLGDHAGDIDIDVDTDEARRNLQDLTDDLGDLEDDAGGIGAAFRRSFLSGIDSGNSFSSSLRSGVGGAITHIGERVTGLKETVVSKMTGIREGFAHPIETIRNGLGGAISHAGSRFTEFVRGADEAADAADDVGGASSDARPEVEDLGNAAEKSGGKFEKLGGMLKGIGKAAAIGLTAATVAVGGFAAASVNTGKAFDSSMSQVAATMGYSIEELNTVGSEANKTFTELRSFAMEMGANTAFSASQAADALNYMALAGYDAETSMTMLPNVLNLAAAGGMELSLASDMVTDAQSALGLTLDETSELVDKMAKASSKSNTSVTQLGDAILTVGGTAKNLAGGTTELSTALGILADNGVKGAEGGTALRNIILSLSAPTDKAAAKLKDMGVEAFDAEGNLRPLNETFGDLNGALSTMTQEQQTQALNEIFNKVDLKSVNALLTNTVSGLGDVGAALESSGVDWSKYKDKAWASAEGMSKGLIEDIKYNLGELGTSAEDLQEYLQFEYDLDAEDAMAVVKSMGSRWDELTGYINDAEGAAEDMANTQLDNLAGDITLFKSALEGAQIVISDQLTPDLRKFTQFGTQAISTLSAAFQEDGLSGAMGALGGILSDAVGMVVDMLPSMVNAGVQLLGALGEGLLSNVPVLIEAAAQIVVALAEGITSSLSEMDPSGNEILTQITDSLIEKLPVLIGAAGQIILTLASSIGSSLPELIPSAIATLLVVVSTIMENLPLVLDAGMQILDGLTQGIIGAIPILAGQLPEIILQIVGFLSENLPVILEQGSQMLLSLGMGIIDAIPQLVAQLPAIISSVVGFITENLPLIVETGVNLIVQLGVGLIQAIPTLVAQLPQIIAAIAGGFAELPGMMLDIGKHVVEGIWNGISQMGSWIKEKVTGFFGGIVDGVKGLLGIHSPSTVFAGIGENMGRGVGIGFTSSMKSVSEEIQDAIPVNLDGPEIDIRDPDMPEVKKPPDMTCGVYPNVENYDLPGNEEAATYTVEHANLPGTDVDDVSYHVNPIIEDIKTPPVSDLTYQISPLVEDLNPPGYEPEPYDNNSGDPGPNSSGGDVGGSTPGPGVGGNGESPPEVNFSPSVNIEITVQGNADNDALEQLRSELTAEFEARMRAMYEEFREEELQRAALKNQYAF